MFQTLTTQPGDCITSDYLQTAFDNIDYLEKCSRSNSSQFVCKYISQTQTGSVSRSSTEICFDLQSLSNTTNTNSSGEIETKLIMFSIDRSTAYNISDGDNPGVVSTETVARIVCNGETIQTINSLDAMINSVCFDCPKNSDVQLCFDSRIVLTGQATFPTGIQSIKLCGALICITETENTEINGYFLPRKLDTTCCYGREAIHLISQNLTALRLAFSEFGQIPSCYIAEFQDDDDHVLLNTVDTETQFLVLGSVTICGQNNSTFSPATINGNPRFTCGTRNYECLSSTLELDPADDNVSSGCMVLPIIICGTCSAGESLTASIRSQYLCNEKPSQVVSGIGAGITLVDRHYCVYSFAKLQSDFGDELNVSLGKCLDIDRFTAINATMDLVNQTCENQIPISLIAVDSSGISEQGDCVRLQSAQPWPPLDDPTNTDPPTIKKWFISGYVQACRSTFAGVNLEDFRLVRATADITCGGTTVESNTSRWQITGSGGSQPCGEYMQFAKCITCPIDQDIDICFDSEMIAGFGTEPNEFNYELKLICF